MPQSGQMLGISGANTKKAGIKGFGCQRLSCLGLSGWLFFGALMFTTVLNAEEHLSQDDLLLQDSVLVGLTAQVYSVSQTRIGDQAFSQASGLVKVNAAAGDGNIQQNSAAAAASEGLSVAVVKTSQIGEVHQPTDSHTVSAVIDGNSFQQARGILMINQAAGFGNRQVNAAAVAIGGLGSIAVVQMDDKTLAEESTESGLGESVGALLPVVVTEVGVDPSAFQNAQGILMLNQSAGINNVSGNSFSLSVTH